MDALILFRHGQTDHNAARRFQGRLDTLLNAKGLAQAERTGDIVAGCLRSFFCVPPLLLHGVTSDLSRASATAQIVAARVSDAAGTPCFFVGDPCLQEWDCGELSDHSVEEFDGKRPGVLAAYYDAYNRDPRKTPYPAGESQDDVERRLAPLVEKWNAATDWNARSRRADDAAWTRAAINLQIVSTHGGLVHCLLEALRCPLPPSGKVIGNGDVLLLVPRENAPPGTWKVMRHYRVGDSVSAALVR